MIEPGTVVFCIPQTDTAIDLARDFCKTRGLNADTARIVKRRGNIEVEIKAPCVLNLKS